MIDERTNELWDLMVELGIATDEEIGLAVGLCGTSEETLNKVLFIRAGLRNLEQLYDEIRGEDC